VLAQQRLRHNRCQLQQRYGTKHQHIAHPVVDRGVRSDRDSAAHVARVSDYQVVGRQRFGGLVVDPEADAILGQVRQGFRRRPGVAQRAQELLGGRVEHFVDDRTKAAHRNIDEVVRRMAGRCHADDVGRHCPASGQNFERLVDLGRHMNGPRKVVGRAQRQQAKLHFSERI
jgi:hypothetical protein